jgi:hypothetical protein
MSSIAQLVGVIVAVLFGGLIGLLADAVNVRPSIATALGAVSAVATLAATTTLLVRHVRRTWPPATPATRQSTTTQPAGERP